MIVRRTDTDPSSRTGYQCVGKVTASTGVITITISGRDYSSKITGLTLTPVLDSATTIATCQITSIAYSAGTTTILGRVFVSDDITTPAMSLSNSTVVHYSFWIDEKTLPTDESTNNANKQEY